MGSRSGHRHEAYSGGRKTFHALDGMRGVAALVVVERHRPEFFTGTMLPGGHLAVDLFFILSGFVIAHAYEGRLRAGLSVAGFMLARLIRLLPLYLAATLFGAALFAAFVFLNPGDPVRTFGRLAASLAAATLFLPMPAPWSFNPERIFPLNEPAWSLFFELVANLLFALLILRLRTALLLGLIVAGGVGLSVYALLFRTADLGFDWPSFVGGFPRVVFGFFMGVMLYRVWQGRGGDASVAATRWHVMAWPLMLLLLAALIWPYPAPQVGWPRAVVELAIILLVFPSLVLAAAWTRPSGASCRVYAALGASSYAVYVFHMPASRFVVALGERAGWPMTAWAPWSGMVFLGALFLFALAAHHLFDLPVRRWLSARRGRVAMR
jgi:peptidoglycan/LPS O-acetylase OafA/YrhL